MIAEAGTRIVKFRNADSAIQSLSGEEKSKTDALTLTVLELMQVYRASLLCVCQMEPGAKQRRRGSGMT